MEELHDKNLAEHHLRNQRSRGGHHPTHLEDPLEEHNATRGRPGGGRSPQGDQTSEATHDESHPARDPRRNGSAPAGQMAFADVQDQLDD
jgi:hypothetical protein